MTTGVGDITIRFICMPLQARLDASGVIHGICFVIFYEALLAKWSEKK